MEKILVTTSSYGKFSDEQVKYLEGLGYQLVINPYGRKLTTEEVDGLLAEHTPIAMVAGVEPLTKATLEKAKGLKVISRAGIGMDNVDLEAAAQLGIAVKNTPDAPTNAVAELALSLILAALRRINISDSSIRAGEWKRPMGNLLLEKTVGLIGCGRIASRTAELLKPFSCRLIGYDPYLDGHPEIELVSLKDLAAGADIISLHLPMSQESKHIIDKYFMDSCKDGVFIINASRGGLVNEEHLIQAIKSGKVAGAALDCYENEPYNGPLAEMDEIIVTAHIGSYAVEGRNYMEMQAARNLVEALKS